MMLAYVVLAGIAIASAAAVIYAALRSPPPRGLTDADIRAELRKGNRLEAIRWYRTLHRVGLKSAKEGVEELERRAKGDRAALEE
jgi:ribosomal protein L7/L12